MTSYPSITPTSRSFNAGNWPIKTFNAQDGAEVRILYGSLRYNHSMSLTYENIPDALAEQFMEHYFEQLGTYKTFAVAMDATKISAGWKGSSDFFNAGYRTQYRYAQPPVMRSVYPGVSTVQVELLATLLPEVV
jgi:hypothetical protein